MEELQKRVQALENEVHQRELQRRHGIEDRDYGTRQGPDHWPGQSARNVGSKRKRLWAGMRVIDLAHVECVKVRPQSASQFL